MKKMYTGEYFYVTVFLEATIMDYYESAKGIHISLERAILECDRHGVDSEQMLADLGEHKTYLATDVLEWLGY